MPSILDLKSKWNKEKIPYTKKEVGDGVQNFVKEVLACPEIFNLKKGLNSAPLEKRKNEFKEEEVKKAARRADVVIFVNPEIVIPMEIERYQNIQAGERQIIQYQLDWNEHSNRRYGILTDGYTWRFYNNNEYREFVLNDIFDKTNEFLEFWNEYTKPEFYYLAFFEKKGQQSLLKKSETLHVEEYRQLFFEDITKLIKSFKNKLKLEGYLKSFDKKEREKKSIELTYAYIIQFILYKTLVDNEFGKFEQEFKDIRQTIYGCLKSEQYGKILGVIDGVSQMISKDIYRPFAKEQEFITQKLLDLIHQPKNELHDVSPWLDIIVFIKKYNFANVRNEIFGYIYENYLKALDEDEKKGQYFTDSAVVNFMLKQIGYVPEEIDRRLKNKPEDNYISIVDPSCGSGTFLYSAVNQIVESVPNGSEKASKKIEELVNNNVYGLDIEEFPLYLAEMNILMRMLPLIINEKYNNPIDKKIKAFKTKDSISEFIDSGLKNTIHDIDVAGGQRALFDSKKLDL
ncbi:N-6 DNA methylase, partial [Patescibacteria group bacterium]|nr:N-6 DNA methylase [Patescibacteria group bacterium]